MKCNAEIQALMDRISAMIQSQDDDSPLEVLFFHYSEFRYTKNQTEADLQNDLRKTLHDAVPECEDQIMDLVHMICFHYERISFINGLKAGVRLAGELNE